MMTEVGNVPPAAFPRKADCHFSAEIAEDQVPLGRSYEPLQSSTPRVVPLLERSYSNSQDGNHRSLDSEG